MASPAVHEAVRVLLDEVAYAIDNRQWNLLRQSFTSEAVIDESRLPGGFAWTLEEYVAELQRRTTSLRTSSHGQRNYLVFSIGGVAHAYTEFSAAFAEETDQNPDGLWQRHTGGLLHDVLEVVDGAWRIARRTVLLKNALRFDGPFHGYRRDDLSLAPPLISSFAAEFEEYSPPRTATSSTDAAKAAEAVEVERSIVGIDESIAHGWWKLFETLVDATVTVDGGDVYGHAADRSGWSTSLQAAVPGERLSTQHLTSNPLVVIEAQQARSVSDFSTYLLDRVPQVPGQVIETRIGGLHEDQWHKADGVWVLASRQIVVKNRQSRTYLLPPGAFAAVERSATALAALPYLGAAEWYAPVTGPGLDEAELADRVDLRRRYGLYSNVVDQEYEPSLPVIYTPTGELASATGTAFGLDRIWPFLSRLVYWRVTQQHLAHNARIKLGDDEGRGVVEYSTISVLHADEANAVLYLRSAGSYLDHYAKGINGWQLQRREIYYKTTWVHRVPFPDDDLARLGAVRDGQAAARRKVLEPLVARIQEA